ncbi:hypothetical protein HXX76_013134 [Chlamydomonas incerta]|uniref:Uncharacterized protein n=1 Tax=Chlamydomonas incerta TaxID=51695 RepID=A0A835SME7_CHLIN|nr:hypothetical protein HXX76_013134 [Chlamydomonas incerta]|eukprot:KAG2426153.1 hypothetical protein HXX76_013134 [Chlamydomonas incerta]
MTGRSKIRICVLQSSVEHSKGAISEVDPYKKPEVYDKDGEFEWHTAYIGKWPGWGQGNGKATSAAQMVALAAVRPAYDVYLNLCDGAWDEDRAGRDVVEALERLNLPYTGANMPFYDPSKIEMKMAAQYYGVQVPAWVHIESAEDMELGLADVLAPPSQGGLCFPLIVKHPSGYGSVGMTKNSKVTDEQQLREQVSLLVQQFGGALIEEFIAGREFTVLVVEEPAAPPAGSAAAACMTEVHGDSAIAAGAAASTASNGGSSSSGAGEGAKGGGQGNAKDAAADLDPDLSSFRVVAYTPVECAFGPGEDFKHFDLKWTDYESLSWFPCADPELAERLKEAARNTFIATRGTSYGRCDFRVDAAGGIYLLEINPNCGVLYPPGLHGSADYIMSLDPSRDQLAFIRTIIASALERHRLKQRKVRPAFYRRRPAAAVAAPVAAAAANGQEGKEQANGHANGDNGSGSGNGHADAKTTTEAAAGGDEGAAERAGSGGGAGGWGLRAVVPIKAGEVVQRNEQRKHVLASKGFVQRCWPEGSRQREWFDGYAYPLNDDVWVTWSDDPNDWLPLNHSCDPNTWLVGLDAVARRDIAPGEQITIDYATFCTEHMAAFDCCCGSAACRGRVGGLDHLADWVGNVYGHHVSGYVAAKRRAAGKQPQAGAAAAGHIGAASGVAAANGTQH